MGWNRWRLETGENARGEGEGEEGGRERGAHLVAYVVRPCGTRGEKAALPR